MRIINQTRWNTAEIRAFVKAVAAEELTPTERAAICVNVCHRKTKGVRDDRYHRVYAPLNAQRLKAGLRYNRFNVKLPAPTSSGPLSLGWKRYLAGLLAHEMAECCGRSHADLRRFRGRYLVGRRSGNWASRYDHLPITVATTPKPDPLVVASRRAEAYAKSVDAALRRWQRKAKLAATKLRHYERLHQRLKRNQSPSPQTPASTPTATSGTSIHPV